jgi:magnesium chelatase family protein
MVTHVRTVAFQGIEAIDVDVQVQLAPGMPAFTIVGLGDKAVTESRERVRGALHACGLALPAKRIIVNLAPADLPKEGSHYDLPIALALMSAVGAIDAGHLDQFVVLGELALDGAIQPTSGVLPTAMYANDAVGNCFLRRSAARQPSRFLSLISAISKVRNLPGAHWKLLRPADIT